MRKQHIRLIHACMYVGTSRKKEESDWICDLRSELRSELRRRCHEQEVDDLGEQKRRVSEG